MAYFNQYIPFVKWLYPSYLCWEVKNKDNKIYLTFDDGPVPEVTDFVLDTLNFYNVKATFFCVGDNVVKHPQIFQRILSEGHSVGNHTHNHIEGWNVALDEYVDNIEICDKAMDALGATPRLFRPPYGKASRAQLDAVKSTHKIIMWNVLTGDFDAKQSENSCLNEAISRTQSGSIILFHDSYKAEKNLRYALPRFITSCLNKGFQFATL